MAKYKVGVTSIGSNLRGFFKEEMAHSNSAVLDSRLFKFMVENDCEFYLLKPMLLKSRKVLDEKLAAGDELAKRIHCCFDNDEYPTELDLIYVQQGSNALNLSGDYLGHKTTQLFSAFHSISKYPNTDILFMQTDIICSLETPEANGTGFVSMFPALFNNRRVHYIRMGTHGEEKYWQHIFGSMNTHLLQPTYHNCSKDFQFVIEVDEPIAEVVEKPTCIAYAGKNRNKGNRNWPLYLTAEGLKNSGSETKLSLIGRWHKVAVFANNLDKLNIELGEKYFSAAEVLDAYNKAGFTIYVSAPEYRAVNTLTSRVNDAVKANCVPLIWHDELPQFQLYFSEFGIPVEELVVTPETADQVVKNWESKEKREKLLRQLRSALLILNKQVEEEVRFSIRDILSLSKEPKRLMSDSDWAYLMKERLVEFVTQIKPTHKMKLEDAIARGDNNIKYSQTPCREMNKEGPDAVKTLALSIGTYFNESIPDEELPQAFDTWADDYNL